MRAIITPDDILRVRPSAAKSQSSTLLELCREVTTQVEGWAGRRFFAGMRETTLLPTGGRLATLPDPPLLTIVSVTQIDDGDETELLLADFGIEDAQAGTIWSSAGWASPGLSGGPRSELDRSESHGYPGGYAAESTPVTWRVRYTSGTAASPRARFLALELAGLYLERMNRQGVTSETIHRVSRSFDFDKAEASIRKRARAMTGRLQVR